MAEKKNGADNKTARVAKHGKKMIEVRLRFFTDKLADGGKILPKHAWTCGMASLQANEAHGVKTKRQVPFNSLLNISSAIEKLLLESGIVLHPDSKMKKYLSMAEAD